MREWSVDHVVGPSTDEYRICTGGRPQFHVYDLGLADFIVEACNQAERIEDALQRVNDHADQEFFNHPAANVGFIVEITPDLAIEDRLRSLRG